MLLQSPEGLHLFVGDGPWSKINLLTGKLRYCNSSTITSVYNAWTCMVPCNVTGCCFWDIFVFHVCLFTLHERGIMQFIHTLYLSHAREAQTCRRDPNFEREGLVRQQFSLIYLKSHPWNSCLPHIIKHGSMHNHAWCFAWSSMRVWSYSWAVP